MILGNWVLFVCFFFLKIFVDESNYNRNPFFWYVKISDVRSIASPTFILVPMPLSLRLNFSIKHVNKHLKRQIARSAVFQNWEGLVNQTK